MACRNPDVTLFPMSNENMSTLPTLNASMRNMHIGWCSCSRISQSHLPIQDKPSNIFSFIRLLFILQQHINFHFVCLRFPARSPRKLHTFFKSLTVSGENVSDSTSSKTDFWNPPSSDLACHFHEAWKAYFVLWLLIANTKEWIPKIPIKG